MVVLFRQRRLPLQNLPRNRGRSGMIDFLDAVGLFLVFEGLLYGCFPLIAKRVARDVSGQPDGFLRMAGVASVAIGVGIVWLARG